MDAQPDFENDVNSEKKKLDLFSKSDFENNTELLHKKIIDLYGDKKFFDSFLRDGEDLNDGEVVSKIERFLFSPNIGFINGENKDSAYIFFFIVFSLFISFVVALIQVNLVVLGVLSVLSLSFVAAIIIGKFRSNLNKFLKSFQINKVNEENATKILVLASMLMNNKYFNYRKPHFNKERELNQILTCLNKNDRSAAKGYIYRLLKECIVGYYYCESKDNQDVLIEGFDNFIQTVSKGEVQAIQETISLPENEIPVISSKENSDGNISSVADLLDLSEKAKENLLKTETLEKYKWKEFFKSVSVKNLFLKVKHGNIFYQSKKFTDEAFTIWGISGMLYLPIIAIGCAEVLSNSVNMSYGDFNFFVLFGLSFGIFLYLGFLFFKDSKKFNFAHWRYGYSKLSGNEGKLKQLTLIALVLNMPMHNDLTKEQKIKKLEEAKNKILDNSVEFPKIINGLIDEPFVKICNNELNRIQKEKDALKKQEKALKKMKKQDIELNALEYLNTVKNVEKLKNDLFGKF